MCSQFQSANYPNNALPEFEKALFRVNRVNADVPCPALFWTPFYAHVVKIAMVIGLYSNSPDEIKTERLN